MLDQELKEERSRETRVDDAPTTKAEVEEMMDTIRRDGISRYRDALLPNFTSLSAPIFDQAGFMIAAITMMGPIGILDDDLKGPTATALIAHARALSATAGWQPN
ncbi:DNA-binding IclR family transcriptional regulator [Bradyrhizobium japonicum]|jgi:DNA-binding IclR family transcriptional regulator|nr:MULTISPECIES: IclR family transcriptional regulator C-terminal domain-containing protein [Bradyrhizobium]MCP1743042.1 DNA-binding IclR family transcriptional regulator [Bradyrhizobium japonicum]MCP1781398.1 DNA-binding IclR family transcriptional regulator [Bradyrhizobium japonicum]MCP1860753.1 DNA-binding IclR family transcriptional regulator [Bradyrhizobium japonicum]MCP1891516.1 DNA-binding IclR family transcriptional regulator [Bradyrhizobium japonicum]MCP1955611.1 DNA-binding IclR fami